MIIKFFDFFHKHVLLRRSVLLTLTIALVVSVFQLSYKEDISDFMPLTEEEKQDMEIYQDISGVNKLVVLFSCDKENPDSTIAAIDLFQESVKELDSLNWTSDMVTRFDMEKVGEVTEFVYQNIPYFLTERDYSRMDSLLCAENYVGEQLDRDREMLMFPSGGLLSENISRDPLNLFTPVLSKLQGLQQENKFEMYDGYIFTPDMSRAIVMLSSPFGNSETDKNSQLLQLLNSGIEQMNARFPNIEAHVLGGPQIAVGNAQQIKHDSILAVSLAVVLILALLFFSFRSLRNILLIAFSIGWGWLFALGALALFHDNISIIVVGISSVILGIALNYPLHLIAHIGHETDIRQALKEISAPLLVGNITTVGAFLALVPLNSVALRDLGLFASLLLIGTIFYVLVFLPHQVKIGDCGQNNTTHQHPSSITHLLSRISSIQLDNKSWVVGIVIILTLVFGWFSFQVEFDSNLANINYMTDEQRADMEYFQKLTADDTVSTKRTLYVVSSAPTIDAALDSCNSKKINGVSQFLASESMQKERISRWKEFVSKHHDLLNAQFAKAAKAKGFSVDAFSDFQQIINGSYEPREFSYFAPLTSTVFNGNIVKQNQYFIVDKLSVEASEIEKVKSSIPGSFDIESLNSSLANSLSDNFNYIGWACSLIVFFFLWFSFRKIELAIISFVPMAISWVWILGLMAILGIKFNIVNVILATFIFGQGDDYTIFMTEGCIYEHKTGKPILASYKRSILLSAIIMFIGIGTLIVAKHPALHSLAEITIVGMSSVVFMSWLVPPLLFRLIYKKKGE
ncbi:MAG: MMPL family transporter [Prevotella sp.]|nr:MMPL family transporter [Prevotella sp.]